MLRSTSAHRLAMCRRVSNPVLPDELTAKFVGWVQGRRFWVAGSGAQGWISRPVRPLRTSGRPGTGPSAGFR